MAPKNSSPPPPPGETTLTLARPGAGLQGTWELVFGLSETQQEVVPLPSVTRIILGFLQFGKITIESKALRVLLVGTKAEVCTSHPWRWRGRLKVGRLRALGKALPFAHDTFGMRTTLHSIDHPACSIRHVLPSIVGCFGPSHPALACTTEEEHQQQQRLHTDCTVWWTSSSGPFALSARPPLWSVDLSPCREGQVGFLRLLWGWGAPKSSPYSRKL